MCSSPSPTLFFMRMCCSTCINIQHFDRRVYFPLQWNLRCKSHFLFISLERNNGSAGPSNLPISSSTFSKWLKKEILLFNFPRSTKAAVARAWECLCRVITGKINKTKSWHSPRSHCEVLHHKWAKTDIALLNPASIFPNQLWRLFISCPASTNVFLAVINRISVFWTTVTRTETCWQTRVSRSHPIG